jgi:replication factor C subunit 3/5
MEKYIQNCRLIIRCDNLSKLIDPLKSRCLMIRIPAPTNEELKQLMIYISKKENFTLENELIEDILNESNRNATKTIELLQNTKIKEYPWKNKIIKIEKIDWEKDLLTISKLILKYDSPKMIFKIRESLYNLIASNLSPKTIFEVKYF